MTDAQAKMVDKFARSRQSLLYEYYGVGFIVQGRLHHGDRDPPTLVLQDFEEPDRDWMKRAGDVLVKPVAVIRIELQRYRIEVPHQRADISAYVPVGQKDAVEMLLGSWSRALTYEEYRAPK